jgi:hypothetical protein
MPRGIWGLFIGGLEHLVGRPAVHMGGRPTFSGFTDFGHHQPTPPTSLDMCMKHFQNTSNPGRLAMEVGPTSPTLARLGRGFVPGQVLGDRAIKKSGGAVCGLHCAHGDEERMFLGSALKPWSMVC